MKKQGFIDYEISNFCLPGEECRHNLTYWELNPYLGLGAGAVSTLPVNGIGGIKVTRLQTPSSLPDFLTGEEQNWGITSETIELTDFLVENLMMGFRLKRGISKSQFKKRFQVDLPDLLHDLWLEWQSLGYLTVEATDAYRLTSRGRLFLNLLIKDVIGFKPELSQALSGIKLFWP